MRKSFFVLAAVACCACSKGVVGSSVVKEEKDVELKFSVPVTASKMSGPVVEDAVENLQVFVFGANGEIQSFGMSEKSDGTAANAIVASIAIAITNDKIFFIFSFSFLHCFFHNSPTCIQF